MSETFLAGILSQLRRTRRAGEPVGFYVDLPSESFVGSDETVEVRGWCLFADPRAVVRGSLLIEGAVCGELTLGQERPDVARHFSQHAHAGVSGFAGKARVRSRRGVCDISVRLVSADGKAWNRSAPTTLVDPPEPVRNLQGLHDAAKRQQGYPPLDCQTFPAKVAVELTTACSLNCVMCRPRRVVDSRPVGKFMDPRLFDVLAPAIDRAKFLIATSWGESTLHPRFVEFITRARNRNPACHISFACSFHRVPEETLRAFVDAGVDHIWASIDGATAGTYEGIRRGADFDAVLQALDWLNAEKARRGKPRPRLTVNTVVLKTNVHELPSMLDVVDRVQAESLNLDSVAGAPELDIDCSEHFDAFAQTGEKAAARGVPLTGTAWNRFLALRAGTATAPAETVRPGHRTPCFAPVQEVLVYWDGKVSPCCFNGRTMGNLSASTFEDVWFGQEYRDLRKEIVDGRPDAYCRQCLASRGPEGLLSLP